VNILLMSVALCITIVLALAIGVVSGYVAIIGILYAFGHSRATKTRPVLIPNAGPTGD